MSLRARPSSAVQAGFWRRLIAFVIDLTILLIVFGSFVWLVPSIGALLGFENPRPGLSLPALLAMTAVFCIYFVVGWTRWGQTIGKKSVGVRVVGASGASVTLPRALLRLAGYGMSFFSVAIGGFSLMDRDSRHEELHDRLSRTCVVLLDRRYTYLGPALAAESRVKATPRSSAAPTQSAAAFMGPMLLFMLMAFLAFLGLWAAGGIALARLHASAGAVALVSGSRGGEPALGALCILAPLAFNLVGLATGVRWILNGKRAAGWGTTVAAGGALLLAVAASYLL